MIKCILRDEKNYLKVIGVRKRKWKLLEGKDERSYLIVELSFEENLMLERKGKVLELVFGLIWVRVFY